MAVRSALIHVMAAAALKAARGLLHDFGEVEQLQVSMKGPGDFVSNADLKAERTLKTELQRARPAYGFLMEESGETKGDGHHRWIVDPLDGTTNFLHGLPFFAISIALERDGEIDRGRRSTSRSATRCSGPRRAPAPMSTTGACAFRARRRLADAVIGTGIPFREHGDHAAYLATLAPVMAATSGVRRWGVASLDLAYVAAGRFDGFWEFGLSRGTSRPDS